MSEVEERGKLFIPEVEDQTIITHTSHLQKEKNIGL